MSVRVAGLYRGELSPPVLVQRAEAIHRLSMFLAKLRATKIAQPSVVREDSIADIDGSKCHRRHWPICRHRATVREQQLLS
jgi:hypothetical protein